MDKRKQYQQNRDAKIKASIKATLPEGTVLPSKERQFRALNPLKDDPEFMALVWSLALKYGGGSARMIDLLAQVLKDEAVSTNSGQTTIEPAPGPNDGDDDDQPSAPTESTKELSSTKADNRKLKLQHTKTILGNLDLVHRYALRSEDPETHRVYSDIVSQLLGLVDNYVGLYDKRNAIHRVAMTDNRGVKPQHMDRFQIQIGDGPRHSTDINIDPKQVFSLDAGYCVNKSQLPVEVAYRLRDLERQLIAVLKDIKELMRPFKGRYDDIERA